MKRQLTQTEKRLRIAGGLLITGLLVELITLIWLHPTAFIYFLFPGGLLIAVGIVVYLIAIITSKDEISNN